MQYIFDGTPVNRNTILHQLLLTLITLYHDFYIVLS